VEKNPVNVTYGGQIWRTLVAPGWGHIYANEWRGWVYLPLWAGSLGTFIYGMIDYSNKEAAYYGATTGLDELYTQMNDALFIRNVAFVAVISIYALTIADTLIFGKNYEIITQEHRAPDVKLYAMILPGFSSEKINKSGDIYVRFEARKMF
jgi:hypothetical protein